MKSISNKMKKAFGLIGIALVFTSVTFAQSIDDGFFNKVDALLKANVVDGKVNYAALKGNSQLSKLIDEIAVADLTNLDDNTIQAFYINAYNLHVINQVVQSYPLKSVTEEAGFFDKNKLSVANQQITLNQLEKQNLLGVYHDARFHFVLVCGALGCPPITDFAYTPEGLEAQMEMQTRKALNDKNFIKIKDGSVELSQIFNWYKADFGSNKEAVIGFINKYRSNKISAASKIKYYEYDWSLNEIRKGTGSINAAPKGSNESRYIVSSTIPEGTFEIKVFNNLYSQKTGDGNELFDRSSFYTTSLSVMYGLNSRFNVGIATRFRKVRNNPLPSSPFSVFGSDDERNSRSGLTAFGPQIRWAPVPKWSNFSVQSSFVFAIGEDLAGNSELPYIDWNGPTWWTQFFNDTSIGSQFSLFTEIDLIWEDIGSGSNGHNNRLSTPATAIFSYIPTNKLTIYTLAGYSPFWQSEFDYFTQFGIGTKYQFTPNFEIELLYTDFSNKSLNNGGGQAETINLGIRINT